METKEFKDSGLSLDERVVLKDFAVRVCIRIQWDFNKSLEFLESIKPRMKEWEYKRIKDYIYELESILIENPL